MIILYLYGETYEIKEELKSDGFKWDNCDRVWYKNFESNELEYVKNLAEAFETTDGVIAEIQGDI